MILSTSLWLDLDIGLLRSRRDRSARLVFFAVEVVGVVLSFLYFGLLEWFCPACRCNV